MYIIPMFSIGFLFHDLEDLYQLQLFRVIENLYFYDEKLIINSYTYTEHDNN